MNLISETHHSYEMREYVFMVLQEYIIISQLEEDKEVGTKRKEIVQVVVLTRRSRRILVAEQEFNS